ncbi:helix-turn-helix domain-containing protein [Amedibacillus sp. YH-ame10]
MINIGGIIRAQMVRKKLHQKDLAEQLNLDQRTISSYCTNKSFPDLDTLSALCRILDIDIRFILDIKEKNCAHLLAQDDKEYKLLEGFRSIPEEQKKEFLESFLGLTNLLKD